MFIALPLREVLENGDIGFPDAEPLPNDDRNIPYFFIGDDAFPLKTWVMKPFSHCNMANEERIFNYRLSQACHIIKKGFGILASRFRCLLTTMQQEPDNVKPIAMVPSVFTIS